MPFGLAALPRQAPDLRLHLRDEVLDALQVGRRFLQAPLGAVLPVAISPIPAASSNRDRRSSARSDRRRSIILASMTTPASLPRPVPRSRS